MNASIIDRLVSGAIDSYIKHESIDWQSPPPNFLDELRKLLHRRFSAIHPTLGTTPKPGEPELHLLLVLSTTHLSKSANQALQDVTANDSRDAGPGCYMDEYHYGYHLTLTSDDEGEWCDDCVKDIVTYAKSIGATHVRLDADGSVCSKLPTY